MPQLGDVIADKYRLEKVAGEGGMGVVYVAEHLVLGQRVAVKILLPDAATSESTVERFSREARTAARVNSEHVARVLDAGSTANGAPFLVMEFLDGCDLEELLKLQKTLPANEAVDYAVQALEGLAHAHAANIVHRDLKPANLFLSVRPDGSNVIKVLDFGISKSLNGKPEDKKLTGHHVLGSPVYMSPEQLRNAPNIDGRADIWSVGVVLYELITGAPPFDGEGVGEIFARILESDPVPLVEKDPSIPKALSDVVLRCLRRDPDERWMTVGELARALAPFASEATQSEVERAELVLQRSQHFRAPVETDRIVAAIDAAAERAKALTKARESVPLPLTRQKEPKRRPALVAGLAAVALVLVGLIAIAVVQVTRAPKPVALASSAQAIAATIDKRTDGEPPPAEAPKPVESATTTVTKAPLPTDTPAPPRAPKAKGGKPVRPKFLNTRE